MHDFDSFNELPEENVEEYIDSLLLEIGKKIKSKANQSFIINPQRVEEISHIAKMLKTIIKGTEVKISFNTHDLFKDCCCISILAKEVWFTNTAEFVNACTAASNIDVYPRTDGKIKFDLTFYGFTKSID